MKDPTIKDIKNFNRNKQSTGKLECKTKQETYNWISNLLLRLNYSKLTKKEKGQVLIFLLSITDYEPSYIRKIVSKAMKKSLKTTKYKREMPFCKYSSYDVRILANTDIVHRRMNSHATKHILEREYMLYEKKEFENISKVSPSHIYNLRQRNSYNCLYKNGTKANVIDIGITKKPEPNGKPGSIRVDTVHQRDIYYVNAIDEVVQWELVFSVPNISEFFLEPILDLMLELFPFKVFNFHSDRGSEYINHTVSRLLGKLRIDQTKSRSRHCNDQALVECKNGMVIRKQMGYGQIAEEVAPYVNKFCVDFLNPYINYHRPCAYRDEKIWEEEEHIVYNSYLTPFEKLKSIKDIEMYLKDGTSIDSLETIEMEHSDNEFAGIMQSEKSKLYKLIRERTETEVCIPNSEV